MGHRFKQNNKYVESEGGQKFHSYMLYIREMSAYLHKTLKLETTQCACIRKWIKKKRKWINKLQHTHKMGYHTARTQHLLCESSHIYKSPYYMTIYMKFKYKQN